MAATGGRRLTRTHVALALCGGFIGLPYLVTMQFNPWLQQQAAPTVARLRAALEEPKARAWQLALRIAGEDVAPGGHRADAPVAARDRVMGAPAAGDDSSSSATRKTTAIRGASGSMIDLDAAVAAAGKRKGGDAPLR